MKPALELKELWKSMKYQVYVVTIPSDENLTEDLPVPIEEGNVSSNEEDSCLGSM